MEKEFSNWTDYDRWLISDYEIKESGSEERVKKNYEKYSINKLEEIDGKIIIDLEERIVEE